MVSVRRIFSSVAFLALACPLAAATAQAPTAEATLPAACELHVWPAERFSALTTGLLGGGLLDAAGHAKGDRQRKSSIADALDSPSQVAALASLDLTALLRQRAATIVQHDEPLTRHTVNDIKTRRSDSKSPCYAELIVADIFYQKAAIYGRSLRTLFIYREFGDASNATRIYKGWGGNGLKLFPPRPGEDAEAANAELVAVFKANFQEFAKNEAASVATRAQ